MPSTTNHERRPQVRSIGGGAPETGTAETDENYDLISVLYHCLKAADACTQYVADAEDAGDDELIDFFESAREQHNRLAAEARAILARCIDAAAAGEEE